jgi:hypothetical protein
VLNVLADCGCHLVSDPDSALVPPKVTLGTLPPLTERSEFTQHRYEGENMLVIVVLVIRVFIVVRIFDAGNVVAKYAIASNDAPRPLNAAAAIMAKGFVVTNSLGGGKVGGRNVKSFSRRWHFLCDKSIDQYALLHVQVAQLVRPRGQHFVHTLGAICDQRRPLKR